MDRFQQMRVFVNVVEAGGFSRATRRLGMSRSAVSKHIADLEDRLETRLLNRTTRRVSLTDNGRRFYDKCRSILDDVEDAERSAEKYGGHLTGDLRIVAPINFGGTSLGPAITDFLIAHPGLRLELSLNDRIIDPIEEGYDLAIRVGSAIGSSASLRARKVSTSNRVLCAAPEYLARRGTPRVPGDLKTHHCLCYSHLQEPGIWKLMRDKTSYEVKVSGQLVTSASSILRSAASRGLGIAYGPAHFFEPEIDAGELVRVLPEFSLPQVSIFSVYPATRYPAAKVTAFNEFMTGYLTRARRALRNKAAEGGPDSPPDLRASTPL